MRFLLLLMIPLISQYWDDTDIVKSLKNHVSEITLAQYEGRAPGSEGEREVARYVWKSMSERGLDMLCGEDGDVFGMALPSGDTLVSRNVMGMLRGYDSSLRNNYIIIGARLDNIGTNVLTVDGNPVTQIYSGANGNASGLAVMLEAASRLAESSIMLKRSVIFIGFGASTSSFAGAWHFLHGTFAKDKGRISAMVNLDMLGVSRDGMKAYTCGNDDLNLILHQLSSSVQPVKPEIIPNEPYPSDHQVFYAGEIPSVMFTTGRYAEHNTPQDTQSILDFDFMEREVEYIYNFVLELANSRPDVPSFYVKQGKNSKTSTDGGEKIVSWSECDTPPMFLNNPDPGVFLRKWVYPYLKYPQECINEGIQGRVMVEFVIRKDGTVTDVHVVRSIDEQLDAEAVKVVAASPKWKPGKMRGQKQNCSMTIPVEFKLKKKK